MAGFRTFATGEVLTAANVNNFLMKQSVMVFADAAARTSALGAEVAEGMLTYNEDTAQLEVFDGAAFVLAGPAGIGSNVVQTVKTDTFTTSSDTFTAVTGLGVTITPTSDTSKILVIADVSISGGAANGNAVQVRLTKAGSAFYVGDAGGARTQAAMSTMGAAVSNDSYENRMTSRTMTVLDSPATTSAVTYAVELRRDGTTTAFVNRTNQANTKGANVASSITAIEVAA